MSGTSLTQTNSLEKNSAALSGWFMLLTNGALLVGGLGLLLHKFLAGKTEVSGWIVGGGIALVSLALLACRGHFTLQPNEDRVLLLFGSYHGTVRQSAFYWSNPFYSRSCAQIQLSHRGGIPETMARATDPTPLPQPERKKFRFGRAISTVRN